MLCALVYREENNFFSSIPYVKRNEAKNFQFHFQVRIIEQKLTSFEHIFVVFRYTSNRIIHIFLSPSVMRQSAADVLRKDQS